MKQKPPPGLQSIKWQPGYRLDWVDGELVVRDALGLIIYRDLMISAADFEYLRQKYGKGPN